MDESCPVTVKADYVLVPVVGTKFNGHGKFYKRRAKTMSVVYTVSNMLFAVILRRLLSKQKLSRNVLTLKYNGPAVEGVNVGGAVRRYESRYFSQKIVPAGKPPWRNFCKSRRTI